LSDIPGLDVAVVLYSIAIPQGKKLWWILSLLTGAFVIGGMAVAKVP
jgi:hypothetical protein